MFVVPLCHASPGAAIRHPDFIKQIQAATEKSEWDLRASAVLPLPFWCWHKHSCGDVVSF